MHKSITVAAVSLALGVLLGAFAVRPAAADGELASEIRRSRTALESIARSQERIAERCQK